MSFLDKNGLARVLLITNVLQSAKIEKVIVPELVEVGSNVVLDCHYNVSDNQFSFFWHFNDISKPIYEWSPRNKPVVRGIFKEKVNMTAVDTDGVRALHITNVTLELNGNYTCRIINHGEEVRQTRTMFVYSPEQHFDMNFVEEENDVEITCNIRGIFPKPDLTIEWNNEVVTKQQRVWQNEGPLYDARSSTRLLKSAFCVGAYIVCRLRLHQADYTAIKKRFLHIGGPNCNCSSSSVSSITILLSVLAYFKIVG